MKTTLNILTALTMSASSAFAAGGSNTGETSFMTLLFVLFGACIVVFQLIPGAMLFTSMLKGLFSKSSETSSAPN